MKNLINFTFISLAYYGIFSVILWNSHINEWHWTARALYIIFSAWAYNVSSKKT